MRSFITILIFFLFLNNQVCAQKIDYSRIDTTKIPSGLFHKLVNSLKGNFDLRFEFLDYNKKKNLIYCAYYAKLDMSAIYDFQLIRPTPNGLVRKLNTLYEPNIEISFKEKFIYVIRKNGIEIYDTTELSKPIYPDMQIYSQTSRLYCGSDSKSKCLEIKVNLDENIIKSKKIDLTINEILVEEFIINENGKIIKK